MPTARSMCAALSAPGRWWLVVAALVMAVSMAYRTATVAHKPMSGLEIESLTVASDLLRGLISPAPVQRANSHERMPGYALLLATIATVDGSLVQGLDCRDDNRDACAKHLFVSVFVLHYLLAVIMLVIVFVLALRLSGNVVISGLALVLTYLATRPGDFAGFVTPNLCHQVLLHAGALLTLLAYQQRGTAWALSAGAAFGTCALFEPHTIVLIPATSVVLAAAESSDRRRMGQRARAAFAVLVGGTAVVVGLTWLAWAASYDVAGLYRHLGHRTVERLAFNGLDFKTTMAGILIWIPLIGDWLQFLLLPENLSTAFGMYRPGSLVYDAVSVQYPAYLARAGSTAGALNLIVSEGLLAQPMQHLVGMLPVFFRGFWASAGLVALFGVLHLRRMLDYARVDGRLADLMVVALPALVLLLVNTALTANFSLLNPLLPFLFAYAIASVAGGL